MKMKCIKCREYRKITRHHIYPKRHYGGGKKNQSYILFCRDCHDDIEKLIPHELIPHKFYTDIISVFLKQ